MESLCVQYEIHRRKPQKGRKFPTQQFMKFASMLWMHKKQTNQIVTLRFFILSKDLIGKTQTYRILGVNKTLSKYARMPPAKVKTNAK